MKLLRMLSIVLFSVSPAFSQEAPAKAAAELIERYKTAVATAGNVNHLALVSKQPRLKAADLEKTVRDLEQGLMLPVRLTLDNAPLETSAVAFAEAFRARAATNVVAFVLLADAPEAELPLTLTALDRRWAVVNTAHLKGFRGEEAVTRCGQVVFRAFAALLGAGYSRDPRSLMVPLDGVAGLAALPHNLEPEAMAACGFWSQRFGLPRLTPQTGFKLRLLAGEVPPANPGRWPQWEERTGKKARDVISQAGFDPDKIAAAFRTLEAAGLVKKPRKGKPEKKD